MTYTTTIYYKDPESWNKYQQLIGDLIKPLIEKHPNILYWFGNYGSYLVFRVHPKDIAEIEEDFKKAIEELKLETKSEATDWITDLGKARFLGIDSTSTAEERALDLFKALNACSNLTIKTVVKSSGLWEWETSFNKCQNPTSRVSHSITHLFNHMMSDTQIVYTYREKPDGAIKVVGEYRFSYLVYDHENNPEGIKVFDLEMHGIKL